MTYDFATLRATLTGAKAVGAMRNNRYFPTDKEVYGALLHCRDHGPVRLAHNVALRASANAGLMEDAPLTKQQKSTQKRNPKARLRRKSQLSANGVRYLEDLRRALYTSKPKPKADRDTLRCYERRFSSAARWAGALVQAQRVNAVDALCRESFASLMDNRALMGGAI